MFSDDKIVTRRSAFRFAMGLCGLFCVILLLSGAGMVWMLGAQVSAEIDEGLRQDYAELRRDPEMLSELSAWQDEDSSDAMIYGLAMRDAQGRAQGVLRPEVYDQDGFATLTAAELFAPRSMAWMQAELDEDTGLRDDTLWRVFVGPVGAAQLVLFEPLDAIESALDVVPWVLGVVAVPLLLSTLLAGIILARRQQRRIDQISARLRAIGRGELRPAPLPHPPRDDLDQIRAGIDDAAAQLDGSIAQLRLFSQNVAHELNTPLARLRAELEALPPSAQSAAALEQADTVIHTLAGVARLARLSHRPDAAALRPVDLAQTAELMDALYSDVASDADQELILEQQAPATVRGDAQLIAQMVSNLIENAIRHAGAGARITARFAGSEVQVRDTGAGLAQGQAERLFTPFEKGARSTGSGLGLAMVQAIATYHGAQISVAQQPGLQITVRFPGPEA